MPTAIRTIEAPQPYRITVDLDAAPSTMAAQYTIARADGGYSAITVSVVWVQRGAPTVAELALSERLLDGVVYVLTINAVGSAQVAFRAAIPPSTSRDDDNPEAEALGVDIGWITGSLDSQRTLPRRHGIAAVKYDLAAIAATRPGELFHLPDDGVGLPQRVNGPGTDDELKQLGGALKRQWSKDGRVARGGITVSTSADGEGRVSVAAEVKIVATGDPVQVRVIGA